MTIRTRVFISTLLALTLLASSCSSSEDGDDASSTNTVAEQPPASVDGGAMIGNTQRSWPDVTGTFDDSPHSTPGQYSVDMYWQRPVWTPLNHDGDLAPRAQLVDGMDICTSPEEIKLQGKTQQQYVNARFLVVNEQAGPTTMTRGVPGGYAHSPQGAVLAAINQFGYGFPAQGDEIGEEIDKELWSTSRKITEKREQLHLPGDREAMAYSRPRTMWAANGYDVITCSPEVMVIDVVYEVPAADAEHTIGRVALFWRDGDWRPDFSGSADDQQARTTSTVDDFGKVSYQ